jgi:hypothetical protein
MNGKGFGRNSPIQRKKKLCVLTEIQAKPNIQNDVTVSVTLEKF